MAMRLSGLMSGMDTESVIQQLVEARSAKVTKAKNEQTKLEWKQEAWKGLNTKLKNLQSKLNDLRFTGGYAKKATKVSDSSIASVLTSGNAPKNVQSMEVKQLAKTAFMTGEKVSMKEGVSGTVTAETRMEFLMDFSDGKSKNIVVSKKDANGQDVQKVIELTKDTTVSDVLTELKDFGLNASFDVGQGRFYINAKEIGEAGEFNFMASTTDEAGNRIDTNGSALRALGLEMRETKYMGGGKASRTDGGTVDFTTRMDALMDFSDGKSKSLTLKSSDGREVTVELKADTTVQDMITKLGNDLPLSYTLGFDIYEQKFQVSAGLTGGISDVSFEFSGDAEVLQALGVSSMEKAQTSGATMVHGQDASITLNGVEYTSSNNVFDINGLTITALAKTDPGKSVTLTTDQDTDGIYDMIKDFLKTYNEIINEMDKLYGAESAKDYEPLSDDEKANMSESEIEKYEQKIKDSLLRRDANLSSVGSAMKNVMLQGVKVNGQQMYLSNFGIETLSYFLASDGERNSYHIDGDPDDTNTAANEDKLKKWITDDPDTVTSFFSQLTMNLYTEMDKQSKAIEGYRSFGSFYDDKKMKSDYDGYKSKIKDLEKKLADYEDKWYSKFAKMETAMAKMQSSANAVTGLLGGS